MTGLSKKSDSRSIGILTIINLFGAIISIVYGIFQARYFGVSREIEIYFAATTLVSTLLSITQTGQIVEIFMPTYHQIKRDNGNQSAHQAFSILFNWMFVFIVVLSFTFWLFAPTFVELITPGFTSSDRALGVDIFRVFIPFLFLDVANAMFIMIFNADKSYGRSETMALCNTILSVVLLVTLFEFIGVWALVVSLWAGKLFQFVSYLVMLKKFGFSYSFKFRSNQFKVFSIFKSAFYSVSYIGATQIYIFVLNSTVTLLPQGSYAVFKYVQQLFTKTNGILMRPVSTVSFTSFSMLLAAKSPVSVVKEKVRNALSHSLFAGIVINIVIIVSGKAILSFLWGSDKFGPEYITMAYNLLCVYFVLLIISGVSQLYRKLVMSFGYVSEQYVTSSIVQLLTTILAYFAITGLGIRGLGLTIVFNVMALSLIPIGIIRLKQMDYFTFQSRMKLVKLLACLISTFSVSFLFSELTGINEQIGVSRLEDFFIASVLITVALLTFLISSVIFKVEEVELLLIKLKLKNPIREVSGRN